MRCCLNVVARESGRCPVRLFWFYTTINYGGGLKIGQLRLETVTILAVKERDNDQGKAEGRGGRDVP